MVEPLDPTAARRRPTALEWGSLLIALIALLIATGAFLQGDEPVGAGQDRWERIKQTGVLRVGYGGYPPYTNVAAAPAPGQPPVTGFSVDLVNAIAAGVTPSLRVEWHQFSFDTMKADLAADRFDFIADPVFMTIPRAGDFAFSRPYSYFGIAVALVRADEARFSTFRDLDRPGITIALAEGWTSSEFARANLTRPTFRSIPVTGDALAQMDEVLLGRADVALNDVPTVLQYARAHPGRVKALWLSTPPSTVAGGFLLRPADSRLREFLDASIAVLQADGTIGRIDRRWRSLGFFPVMSTEPGAGISAQPPLRRP